MSFRSTILAAIVVMIRSESFALPLEGGWRFPIALEPAD